MKKNMYSLMLTEDVVREIDKLAGQQGTNRSNLINQILAEYVRLVTPEKRINSIFSLVRDQLASSGDYDFVLAPHELTMSVKSALSYKYRPTIKYDVQLYRTEEECFGELRAVFRTQSADLLLQLSAFFRAYVTVEGRYLSHYFPDRESAYRLEDGRFVRTFRLPRRDMPKEALSAAITAYIRMFDDAIKGWLEGRYASVEDLENRYLSYLNSGAEIL